MPFLTVTELPTDFLAQRRECIILAAERVYFGDKRPIPQMTAWPGIYAPPVKIERVKTVKAPIRAKAIKLNQRLEHPRRVGENRLTRAECRGDLEPGTEVISGNHRGKIVGFLPPNVEPTTLMPVGTPISQQAAHKHHGPSYIARYCVIVIHRGKTIYHFPKATTIERQVASCSQK